jgi:hypothetical protein
VKRPTPEIGGAFRLAAALVFVAGGAVEAAPRLSSPPPGSVVSGSDVVTISVSHPPAGASEWEAFVSLDGGRSYPLRVTPHLPIGELSFPWTVPALPSADVRVKARFGGRGGEEEFVFAETFSIAPGRARGAISADSGSLGLFPAAGEEGTVAWIDRDTRGIRLVVPVSLPGVEPASRWRAFAAASLPSPRRRDIFTPPAVPRVGPPAEKRPPLPPRISFGRTIASLSRLNV